MAFLGVLEVIGKDFAKGLKWALQYALPAEKLAALLFPAAAPQLSVVEGATTLIQNAVILVEQKYAASGGAERDRRTEVGGGADSGGKCGDGAAHEGGDCGFAGVCVQPDFGGGGSAERAGTGSGYSGQLGGIGWRWRWK